MTDPWFVSATGVDADTLGPDETAGTIRAGTQADMVARRQGPPHDPKVFADPDTAAPVLKSGHTMKGETR